MNPIDKFSEVPEEKLKKVYLILKVLLWILALSTMIGLSIKDSIELTEQYITSKPVAKVSIVDARYDGFQIPNATVCLLYQSTNNDDKAMNLNETFSSLSYENRWLLSDKLVHLDQRTFITDWWKDIQRMTLTEYLESLSFNGSWTEEEFVNFRSRFAHNLCKLLDVNLLSIPNWEFSNSINIEVCDLANRDQAPFVMGKKLLCFRLPTDMLTIRENSIKQKSYMSDNPFLSTEEKIIFTVSPLANQYFMKIDNFDKENDSIDTDMKKNVLTMVTLFPEKPVSYLYTYEPLIDTLDTQFLHAISYPQDIDYATETIVNVQLEITGKIHKLSDRENCIDVYNKTNCIVSCRESVFADICNCTLYSFRHFSANVSAPICSPQQIFKCAPMYNNFLQLQNDSRFRVDEIDACFNQCSLCSQLKFSFTISQITKEDKSSDVCQKLKQYGLLKSNVSCETFKKRKAYHVANAISLLRNGQCQECSNETVSNLTKEIFGRVRYTFSLKSFTYPLLDEYVTLTKEGFISQIGGILGLYLGFSFIAFFTILIHVLQLVKHRWQQRKEQLRHLTLSTTAILQLWTVLSAKDVNAKSSKQDGSGISTP